MNRNNQIGNESIRDESTQNREVSHSYVGLSAVMTSVELTKVEQMKSLIIGPKCILLIVVIYSIFSLPLCHVLCFVSLPNKRRYIYIYIYIYIIIIIRRLNARRSPMSHLFLTR